MTRLRTMIEKKKKMKSTENMMCKIDDIFTSNDGKRIMITISTTSLNNIKNLHIGNGCIIEY